MLVRNVGHLMTNPPSSMDGNEIPEGMMDAMMTGLIALHDIGSNGRRATPPPARSMSSSRRCTGRRKSPSPSRSSARRGALGLARNTVKMGIMDEERRTTVNLKECIRAAKQARVFINTGFLDRTGDEIHTSMEAGPMIRKGDMKRPPGSPPMRTGMSMSALNAACRACADRQGHVGHARHDGAMLEQKIGHPKAGANTAWVPSPTAATLHATHYHKVNVADVQES
jgi:malate synthase